MRRILPNIPWSTILWAVGIFILVLLLWLNFPVFSQVIGSRVTPTPVAATATNPAPVTPQPTASSTPAPPDAPTATELPSSKFFFSDPSQLDPPLRGVEHGFYVLQEESAAVNPEFSNIQWIPSSRIGEQLGFEITENFYATFGSGEIRWEMDTPLPAGLYEIFVMDTVYSSAGALDFRVTLGAADLAPIYGSRHVDFYSSRSENPQNFDLWRSLGIYAIPQADILAVSTAWQTRDEDTIVAVDRVVILPLLESSQRLIEALPKDRLALFVDDRAAQIKSSQILFPESSPLAWEETYQFIVNPSQELTARWSPQDPQPIGTWEVAVWIPQEHATGSLTYRFFVNDEEIANDQSGTVVSVNLAEIGGGRWISLGTWTTPRIYEKPVKLALEMTVSAGTTGEIPLDVVAFLKVP